MKMGHKRQAAAAAALRQYFESPNPIEILETRMDWPFQTFVKKFYCVVIFCVGFSNLILKHVLSEIFFQNSFFGNLQFSFFPGNCPFFWFKPKLIGRKSLTSSYFQDLLLKAIISIG